MDTNLLLYAANPDAPEHAAARGALNAWRQGDRSWFLTWGIVYEFLRVSTHPNVFTTPLSLDEARTWVAALLAGPRSTVLIETERHGDALASIITEYPRVRGNIVHDLHTVALMREHGVTEIRTADTDFHQFTFLTVVNPL